MASCGVWQAFAVSWLCALPIYKKPPRRRQAAGHREIVAQEGRIKEAQEFPSFARKPRDVPAGGQLVSLGVVPNRPILCFYSC